MCFYRMCSFLTLAPLQVCLTLALATLNINDAQPYACITITPGTHHPLTCSCPCFSPPPGRSTTTIRNVYNWRVKETERMVAIVTELRKLGATVEEGRDYCVITPPKQVRPRDCCVT